MRNIFRKWSRYHYWHIVYDSNHVKGYRILHCIGTPTEVASWAHRTIEKEIGSTIIITTIRVVR
jgi:hypothetical protein